MPDEAVRIDKSSLTGYSSPPNRRRTKVEQMEIFSALLENFCPFFVWKGGKRDGWREMKCWRIYWFSRFYWILFCDVGKYHPTANYVYFFLGSMYQSIQRLRMHCFRTHEKDGSNDSECSSWSLGFVLQKKLIHIDSFENPCWFIRKD